jgi:signal transduction histidine kinase
VNAPSGVERIGTTGRILVVDDQESNRQLLRDLLEHDGHQVLEAADGITALDMAARIDPDVILLDVSMPGLDGFEVCRRLRASAGTQATPILLVTALDQREHRLQGVSAGANDYLVKPIDSGEVALRVRNAVQMRGMHRLVEEQYRTLQRVEQLRENLVSMVAHDIRSPLTGLRGVFDLVQASLAGQLSPTLLDMLAEGTRTVDRLANLVSDMLDVSRMESDAMPLHPRPLELRHLVADAVRMVTPHAAAHDVTLAAAGETVEAVGDAGLIHRVVVNLIANAIRFSPPRGVVTVQVGWHQGDPEVRVHDQGPGIPLDQHQRIFEKFGQLDGVVPDRGRTSGLGLTFCRMVIERHRGAIGLDSAPGAGSIFWFRLPVTGASPV